MVIRHNTIINENGQTSAVMINNQFGPVSNIVVDGNYLAGGGYTLYSDGSHSSSDTISGVQFINNKLGEGHWGYYYFRSNSPLLSSNEELGESWPTPISDGSPDPDPVPGDFTGTGGDDVLNGTSGGDTLKGLAGNDTYTVNHTGDKVVEVARQGSDTVESMIGCTLSDYVEKLQLMGTAAVNGTGNGLNNVLTGNDSANTLSGRGHKDVLNGLGGKDTLFGGAGKDTFQFSSENDANDDKVMDFLRGKDKLDFSKIDAQTGAGDQAFSFGGYKSTGSNGQIWVVEDDAANVTHVYAKVNNFQFVVDLQGVDHGLTGSDFLL